jgi:hypothetical protein
MRGPRTACGGLPARRRPVDVNRPENPLAEEKAR